MNQQFMKDAFLEFADITARFNPISTNNLKPSMKNNLKTNLTKSKRIKSAPILATASQPSIVLELENYVQRELAYSHLTCPPDVNLEQLLETQQVRVDARLQVFREAWVILVQKLVAYAPLLSDIKCAYEEALEIRNARIEDMDILKKSLLAIEAKAEGKMALVRTQGGVEIAGLLEEKIRLLRRIDHLKAERDTHTKIIDKLTEELASEHMLLIDQIDSRRLLSFDLQQLRQQMDLMRKKMAPNPTSTQREDNEDPTVLRLALTKCRESLSDTARRLNEMEANYTEVVPKRDLDRLEEDHKALTIQSAQLNRQVGALQSQCEALEQKYKGAKMECNQMANKNKSLQKTGTPRPDWNKCAEFVRGGIQRWRELIGDKSSDDRLNILLAELSTGDTDERDTYFQGHGMDESVPTYLHYEGMLKNRRLKRRDVSIIINDIWKERNAEPTSHHLSMQDHVAKYFQDHFHIPLIRYEWAYSLAYACEKLAYDDQIGTFWGVLNGQIHESIYHSHIADIFKCRQAAKKRMEFMNLREGVVPALVFSEIVRAAFPFKTDKQVAALVEAASKQPGTRPGEVNVLHVLEETEEGIERTQFSHELACQTKIEQEDFVQHILKELGSTKEPFKLIPPEQLKKAFNAVDPKIDDLQMGAHLKWVYGDENLKISKPLLLSLVSMKLLTTNIRKSKNERKEGIGL